MSAAAGGHLLHALPLLVPVVAVTAVLLPDAVRRAARTEPAAPLLAVSLGTAAAAAVHLAVMPEHVGESVLVGVFFLLLAVGQAAYAWSVLLRPSRAVLLAGALGNAAVVALWAVTRTSGLPFGPVAGEVEPVGVLDLVAGAAELVAVVGCALLLLRARGAVVGGARGPAVGQRRR